MTAGPNDILSKIDTFRLLFTSGITKMKYPKLFSCVDSTEIKNASKCLPQESWENKIMTNKASKILRR